VLEQLSKNIRERNLFRDGEHILVAVSGGVDSIALLQALNQFDRWKITVAHFNHKLRGRDSDADQALVQKTAKQLGLKCVTASADVKAYAKESGQSIEMAARELRHRFLATAACARRIKTIALAHHADDQIELFFLRLLRGTSGEGLAGMKWRSPSPQDKSIYLVRPLLSVPRKQIETFAGEKKFRWREDATNQSFDFLRNRIRNELVPLLETHYQPALRKTILRTMELLGDESEVVTSLTKKPGTFARLPIAVQRRLVQQQLFKLRLPADFATVESLRVHPQESIELNPDTRVRCSNKGTIEVVSPVHAKFARDARKVKLGSLSKISFGGCELNFRVIQKTGATFHAATQTEYFDAEKIGRVIALRHWQPGDRFHPIGAKTPRKLQDIFVDLKVPREQRHNRVVATTSTGAIFWIEGVRISEPFKLTSQTKRRLVLRWKR
jgi:tRNA(Ile)-lysidine synthase